MRIDRVVLVNIGPHERLEVTFGAGIIGVVGANGSGKSTLINAIYAALTGDFSRLGDTKADAIHNAATGKSYVEVHGTHGGKPFAVYRGLKPNKTTMSFGDTEINMTRTANEELLARLGVPKLIIDHYVFVDQWKMFGFLDQRESERAKVMQYLCRTEKAEQVFKAATAFVARHSASQIIDNSVELTQLIDEQQAQLAAAVTDVDAWLAACPPDAAMEQWEQLIANYAAYATATTDAAEKDKLLQQRAANLNQVDVELLAAVAEHVEAEKVAETWRQKATRAQALRSKLAPISQLQADLAPAVRRQEKAKQRHATIAPVVEQYATVPTGAEFDTKHSEIYSRMLELTTAGRELKADLENTREVAAGVRCPRCHQRVSTETVDRWKAELEQIAAELKSVSSEKRQLDEVATVRRDYEEATLELRAADTLVGQLQRQLQQLEAGASGVTLEQCDSVIRRARRYAEQQNEKAAELTRCKVAQARAEEAVNAAEKNLQAAKLRVRQLEDQLEGKPKPEVAERRLQKGREARQQLAVAKKNVSNLQQQVQSTTKALASLKSRIAKHRQRQAKVQLIADVADVFHWQRLPKEVAQDNLARLVSDINETLELFRDPFTVAATQDLMFDVYFPGKPAIKATQLSGGQKVVLAVAFRMALDRLFGTDVGMLFLDEPTAGLDADNVAYFHEALQVLARRMEGQRQVVVITHVHEFSDRFDSVVEITTK